MENIVVKKSGGYEYVEEGDGEPLVLLHGLFGQLSNYIDLVKYFSGKYRVIIPSLPIYSLPIRETSLQAISTFLEGFFKEMKLDTISLLGNSMGGHVGLIFTTRHPEMVKLLILTGSSGLYENSFGEGYPKREDYAYLERKVRITFYDPAMATKELVDECYALVNNREMLFRILALAKSAIRHNMASDLPDIKIPVCLIWGRNDQITPPEVAVEFEKLLPDAELFWIDECGHAPMMEKPAEFNRILEKWLSAHLMTPLKTR